MPYASWFSCPNLWSIVCTPKTDFMDDLPDDILHKIFNKLPIKAIGQCMPVRKRWYSLLKSPSFLSVYNNTKREKSKYLIVLKNDNQLQVYADNRNMDLSKLFTLPVNKFYNFPHENCIAICNGLICFAKDTSHFFLWNPFIKKILALPQTIVTPHRPFNYQQHIAFAFDSLANDYKVIRILQYGTGMDSDLHIFSMNHNSWKFSCQVDRSYSFVEQSPLLINDSLYFIAIQNSVSVVLEFNVNAESFHRIKLPHKFETKSPYIVKKLAVDKDSFLVLVSQQCDYFFEIELWVMKEHRNPDSWSNIWKFKEIKWNDLFFLTNLRTKADMNQFVGDYRRDLLQSFSTPQDNMITEITTERVLGLKCLEIRNLVIRNVFKPYEKSLMLLDNNNAVNDEQLE